MVVDDYLMEISHAFRPKGDSQHACRAGRAQQERPGDLPDEERIRLAPPDAVDHAFEGAADVQDQLGAPIREDPLDAALRGRVLEHPIGIDVTAKGSAGADSAVFHSAADSRTSPA